MVSSCVLNVDNLELTGQKAYVPDFLKALFQESDRFESHDNESEQDVVEYRATRGTILKRLGLIGCTESLAHERFEEWRNEEIETRKSYQEEGENDETLDALQSLTWNEWKRRVPDVIRTRYDLGRIDKYVDEIDRNMKDYDPSWLWFDGYDSLLSVRAILDASPDFHVVSLDVGGLISAGWIEAEEQICANKIRVVAARGEAVGPTIILAEGKSDIAILKASIRRFHPDLSDFLTFLDHSEFKVDGGVSYVVKFLKAFAAARVPVNIVAVFDNDAAGLSALNEATALNLPQNMVCVRLPDIELGKSYPTVGPQGVHRADINGRACGIEVYLGIEALTKNGALRPVRWTGYDKHADAYQGEVDGKVEVQDVFIRAMQMTASIPADDYLEMRSLWGTILEAASRAAEASQRSAHPRRHW